jgi:hypothetical protein
VAAPLEVLHQQISDVAPAQLVAVDQLLAGQLRLPQRGAQRAENHMIDADAAQIVWAEETVTELVLAGAHPEVTTVTFTKRQEGCVGADWLWWWLDEAGEAFGMLVQAKRLREDWSIDFLYRGGEQLRLLRESAEALKVPDVFALYLGARDFRVRMRRDSDAQMRMLAESGAAVSVVPGWIVRELTPTLPETSVIDVPRVIAYSLPLEDLVEPGVAHPIRMPRQGEPLPELQSFLTQPQDGAQIVARNVLALAASQGRVSGSWWPPGAVADRRRVPGCTRRPRARR